MIAPRNHRSARHLLVGVAAAAIAASPALLAAQEVVAPKTHTVKKGDTLWDLAAQYLADAFRWPEIYRLNTDVVEDPHWIYPGEVLKLPGYVGGELPRPVEPARDVPVISQPTVPPGPSIFGRDRQAAVVPAVAPVDTMMAPAVAQNTIRFGDYIRAPWVERREGPATWGRILGSADLPGIDPARQRGRFQLNDRILIAPPVGAVAPERELYLTYQNGPYYEEAGQVIIPTGVIEIIRPPIGGDAAVARIVRMFGEVNERDRIMPYDSSSVSVVGVPSPVRNGPVGEVRWIQGDPVLPAIRAYLLLSLTANEGIKAGDEVELYQARQRPREEGEYGIPEVVIGRAQVVRVTPFGATAMITRLDQPKVQRGTLARVVAKMQ